MCRTPRSWYLPTSLCRWTQKEKRWNSIIKAFAKAGDAVELNTRTQSDLVKMLVSGAKSGAPCCKRTRRDI